jgi:hypothetical protein
MTTASEIFTGDIEKEFDNIEDIIFLNTYLFLMNLNSKDSFEMYGRGVGIKVPIVRGHGLKAISLSS